jgi:hypothetical protein
MRGAVDQLTGYLELARHLAVHARSPSPRSTGAAATI